MTDITVNYTKEYVSGTVELLRKTSLAGLIESRCKGGALSCVAIKPNMVLAKPPSSGATTHSEVVEGIILFLRDGGGAPFPFPTVQGGFAPVKVKTKSKNQNHQRNEFGSRATWVVRRLTKYIIRGGLA